MFTRSAAVLLVGLLGSVAAAQLHATEITLEEWTFNVDGTAYDSFTNALGDVPGLDSSGFDDVTGLGSLVFKTSTAGSHTFIAFLDQDIDYALNGYDNENGAVTGTLPAGESFEIDEPGFRSVDPGDIYDNVFAGALDNTNALDTTSYPNGEDVSMALGFDFTLLPAEMATIGLTVSETAPAGGFYLTQVDKDSGGAIYYSGNIAIAATPPAGVPLPGTLLLMGAGLAGIGAGRRVK